MISQEILDLLRSDAVRLAIFNNIERDPFKIALDRKIPHANIIATQVKYLQRAKAKLPSFYEHQCIIPSLAFEQSSSEFTAKSKSYSGELCIDLTCGLGIDSLYFSKTFARVISIERDSILAQIAAYNFERLGIKNAKVECKSAEDFLNTYSGEKADVVYIDPDRRDNRGSKRVVLQDCSPNVLEIMPELNKIAKKVVVKLSPMFDVDEAFRLFGDSLRVEVVSVDGECKEVMVEIDRSISNHIIAANIVGVGKVEYIHKESFGGDFALELNKMQYLIVPDVALVKARIAQRYYSEHNIWLENNNSFGFASDAPQGIFGKIYEIESIEKFSPKFLKKKLKEMGVKRINILRRDFDLSSAEILRDLGLSEGGETFMAFTKIENKLAAILLKRRCY